MSAFAERVQGRLDRLGLSAAEAARTAGLPSGVVEMLLDGNAPPRGRRLLALAAALDCSVAYLVGLDPDAAVPDEFLQDDQGELGLLATDEEALLRAYRRMDVPARAALQLVAARMAPEPEVAERRPRQVATKP